ncbi:MAG: GGDEF domain-containing protein [Lachnospiraceae bacterium]|nr:GGDEF domain-containing protein [Lachnospiraceae bacterium]
MKKRIAVFASGWGSEILSQYTHGLMDSLRNEPADVFLFMSYPLPGNTVEENKGEYSIFSLPNLEDFDGVVIFANSIDNDEITTDIIKKCHEVNIPVIAHGREFAGSYSITVKNYDAMCQLVEHLITVHDVKNILFLAGSKGSADSNERLSATISVFDKFGYTIDPSNICYTDFDNRRTYLEVKNRITKYGKPDAIICVNDGVAMAACLALEDIGVSVPKDIIVTGFDCLKEGQVFFPSLTTINQHFVRLGSESGDLLSNILAGKFCSKKSEVPCYFCLGESCACQYTEVNHGLRRKAGRAAFASKNASEGFERKTGALEGVFRNSNDFESLHASLTEIYSDDHEYEGANFHFVLDPLYKQSVMNNDYEMQEGLFSETAETLCSIVENQFLPPKTFLARDILPYTPSSDEPHLYIITPLHDGQYIMGYLVFADDVNIVETRSLQRYQAKLGTSMNIFRQNQAMAHLNAELTKLSQLDALTHVKSRTAFFSREQELEHQMAIDPELEYAIAMFDINNLKKVNDTLGHDSGDQYIINCCRLICDTFKYSSVYRVGGDEFVAVLSGKDYEMRQKRFEEFDAALARCKDASLPLESQISIASGIAVYNRETDTSVQKVLKSADARMYENKKIMKREHLI